MTFCRSVRTRRKSFLRSPTSITQTSLNSLNSFDPTEYSNPPPELDRIDRYFAIKDLEKAKKLAWHQGVEPPFISWNGLRTKAAKPVYTYYFENKINMNLIDDYISSEIMKTCETSISAEFMSFFDDIYGDFVEIARGKLVGISTTLHESMWEAYKEGFFPCGWKGEFPNGKLCVFFPVLASK